MSSEIEGSQHGSLVAPQMLDVATRVQAIREFDVQQKTERLVNFDQATRYHTPEDNVVPDIPQHDILIKLFYRSL